MGGKGLMQDSQQAAMGGASHLPDIGRNKEKYGSPQDDMPINVGRSVQQEAEEWVQGEDASWPRSAQQVPAQQVHQQQAAAGAAAVSPGSQASQFSPSGLGQV